MISKVTSAFARSFAWFANLGLSKEHIGMILAIAISTYHVVMHMQRVEGWTAIAIIMGGVLGYLNAIFAIQLFEAQDETRSPALAGLILSMVVSIYMQYSFYDNNVNLTAYRPVPWFNLSAFLSGSYLPLFEFILGSLYGVRMRVKRGQNTLLNQSIAQWQAKLDEQSKRFSDLLTDHQRSLDHANDLRIELVAAQEKIAQLSEQLGNLKTERAVLSAQLNTVQLNTVQIDHRHPQPAVQKPTARLSTTERQQKIRRMNESGQLDQHNVTTLSTLLGVALNTMRSDLRDLGIALKTQENKQQKLQA
jgi:hypothetical protein